MDAQRLTCLLVLAVLAVACGSSVDDEAPGAPGAPTPELAGPALDPDDPTILRRPFTAEQIREEWIPGFTVTWRRSSPAGISYERWTVRSADESSVELESVLLDEKGEARGEPTAGRETWIELRDHATFPVTHSELEAVTRQTALGEHEGWLYTVQNPTDGTRTEFFFARAYPGAPLEVRTWSGDEPVAEMVQLERHRP